MFNYMTTDITRVDMTRVHTVEADGKEKRISERFERCRSSFNSFMGLFRAEQQKWKRQANTETEIERTIILMLCNTDWCKNAWENWHDIQMYVFCAFFLSFFQEKIWCPCCTTSWMSFFSSSAWNHSSSAGLVSPAFINFCLSTLNHSFSCKAVTCTVWWTKGINNTSQIWIVCSSFWIPCDSFDMGHR